MPYLDSLWVKLVSKLWLLATIGDRKSPKFQGLWAPFEHGHEHGFYMDVPGS